MDAISRHRKNLSAFGSQWRQTEDPVRRMAHLRELFRETHQLINEVLIFPNQDQTGEIHSLHQKLQNAAEEWEGADPTSLQDLLSGSAHPIAALSLKPLRSESFATNDFPEPLLQSGRHWERLIWRAAFQASKWSPTFIREYCGLQNFTKRSTELEREYSSNGILLAVSCLTLTGEVREWEWLFLVFRDNAR